MVLTKEDLEKKLKLTKEEEECLKNNPNRTSYADFSNKCEKLKELKQDE